VKSHAVAKIILIAFGSTISVVPALYSNTTLATY